MVSEAKAKSAVVLTAAISAAKDQKGHASHDVCSFGRQRITCVLLCVSLLPHFLPPLSLTVFFF